MADRPEEILIQAEVVWRNARSQYRDASIRVGGLLASYVVACLKEADGKPEADRLAGEYTREWAMENAAERLGMLLRQAWEKVRIFKVVELMGSPGELSYSSLRAFTVFVGRKRCTVARGKFAKHDEVMPSQSEVWELKLECRDNANALYRRAVNEGWDSKKIRKVVNEMQVKRRCGRRPKTIVDKRSSAGTSLRDLGKTVNPKDLVDMVCEMISVCPHAGELKRLLMERIKP